MFCLIWNDIIETILNFNFGNNTAVPWASFHIHVRSTASIIDAQMHTSSQRWRVRQTVSRPLYTVILLLFQLLSKILN